MEVAFHVAFFFATFSWEMWLKNLEWAVLRTHIQTVS